MKKEQIQSAVNDCLLLAISQNGAGQTIKKIVDLESIAGKEDDQKFLIKKAHKSLSLVVTADEVEELRKQGISSNIKNMCEGLD